MHTWDPDRYLTFADERSRPFVDLLARVGASAPSVVVDLGCGPAPSPRCWPAAGRTPRSSGSTRARRWSPGRPPDTGGSTSRSPTCATGPPRTSRVDVLVSNATLQWVPGHLDLLPRLVERVAPGGWLAFQVPANFDEPSHTIRRDLAAEPPYAEHTAGVAVPSSHDPAVYLELLAGLGLAVDAWETTYLHVLTGEDPVFTWVSGTGARPTLQALPSGLREEFEAEFRRRLRAAYPVTPYGVVLPFRRVFVVAQRGDW